MRQSFTILILFLFFALPASAQKKARVELLSKILPNPAMQNCRNLALGEIIFYQKPDYPNEAIRTGTGGVVEITIGVDEKGRIQEIEHMTGDRFLQGAAALSVKRGKFSPTKCDDKPVPVSALMVYNFVPPGFSGAFFIPQKIEDLSDITSDSQFYEPILYLTENYKIAFGYSDGKFHPQAPVTRGDFTHFLRLTLDMLSQRTKLSNKTARRTNFYSPFNPFKLDSAGKLRDLRDNPPYEDSVKFLLQIYNISLADEKQRFNGGAPLTYNQVIELWTNIFGEETVPVNFLKIKNRDSIMTRGEFSLFLRESLEVLTYKVLPVND